MNYPFLTKDTINNPLKVIDYYFGSINSKWGLFFKREAGISFYVGQSESRNFHGDKAFRKLAH